MDYSLPHSSVHGIFQARVLEWAAISFSRGSSWPRDRTWVSRIVGRHLTIWATREAIKRGKGQCKSPKAEVCLACSRKIKKPSLAGTEWTMGKGVEDKISELRRRVGWLCMILWTVIKDLASTVGEGNDNPLQYSCLGNSMDRGPWQATVHGVAKRRTWLGH